MQCELRLICVDNSAPWIRALFAAMSPEIEVHSLRINSLGAGLSSTLGALRKNRAVEQIAPNHWQHYTAIPGWSRAYRLSTAIVTAKLTRILRAGDAKENAVIYNIPQLAGVAENVSIPIRTAYYANDAFRFYAWSTESVIKWENQLLASCNVALASSGQIAKDLQESKIGNVVYFPNAVSSSFLHSLAQPRHPPGDLVGETRSIIGCIGQMNRSYDWRLIEGMAAHCIKAVLVFVGPIIEPDPAIRATIERVLAKPNIRWLGAKPHDELPDYLHRFDVCLNPLAVNDHNNRRCPLRLFDYLTTDKPIISTGIAEAFMHQPHIAVGKNIAECCRLAAAMIDGSYKFDLHARREYILRQTWEKRAAELLEIIRSGSNHNTDPPEFDKVK